MVIVFVECPKCEGEFYVGPEYQTQVEAPCHCPYCGQEFPFAEGDPRNKAPQ